MKGVATLIGGPSGRIPRMSAQSPAPPGRGPHADLEAIARRGRLLVLESTNAAGAGHVGGPLSAMDLLVALYLRVMRVRPAEPDWEGRDRFVLSKGHSAIGLYTAMALAGYLPVDELATFDQAGSRLQGHPDMTRLPGLDASTGSLGQGISVGVGMALGARLRGLDFHTWVMLGDGELQEGQVWESVQVAAQYGLGNLTVIVDRNGMQQYGWPLRPGEAHRGDRRDPLGEAAVGVALEAFGWRVVEIDGHDFGQIIAAGTAARAAAGGGAPTAILATTVKGQGVSFTSGASAWHARAATADEVAAARAELGEPTP
jgi:transketolase